MHVQKILVPNLAISGPLFLSASNFLVETSWRAMVFCKKIIVFHFCHFFNNCDLSLDFAQFDPLATHLWAPPPPHPPRINSHLCSNQQLKKKCFITQFWLVLKFFKWNGHFSILSDFGHGDLLWTRAGTCRGPREAIYGIFPPLLIVPQVLYHRQFNPELTFHSETPHCGGLCSNSHDRIDETKVG